MGIVYRARHRASRRLVALKLLRTDHLVSEEKVNRFQREVQAMARLDHPGILPVYEVGRQHGQPYFSMKLVEEGSLQAQIRAGRWRMAEEGPRAWQRRIAALIEAVARAVHHAHQRGILHRDLKPANILVDAGGQPFVTDFGLAKFIEPGTDLTSAQVFLGTPDYSSPEQARGQTGDLTTATDVWGLGVMFYELLTGRIPFRGDSSSAVLEQIKLTEPIRPRLINAVVDRDLETICLKCLEKEPGHRYGSADALAEDLRRYREGEPVQARPVSQGERLWKWIRRRPVLAGWIGATGLALILGLTISTWQWWRAERMVRKQAETAAASQIIVSSYLQAQGAPLEALDRVASGVEIAPHSPPAVRRLLSMLSFRSHALPVGVIGSGAPADGRIIGARHSPDGRQLLSLSLDGRLQVWDATAATTVGPACQQTGTVNLFGFSPDGQMIFAANGTRNPFARAELRIWRVGNAEPIAALAHWGALLDVRFGREGKTVVTSDFGTVREWSLDSGQASNRVAQLVISAVALSEDGRWAAIAPTDSDANAVAVWDVESGTRLTEPLLAGSRINGLALDVPGERLMAVCEGGHLHSWQIPGGMSVTAGNLETPLTEVRLNRSGDRALIRGGAQAHSAWLFATTNLALPVREYPADTFSPGSAFSRDGSRFVLVNQTTATLHRSVDGGSEGEPLNAGWWIEDTDFDATGKRLVLAASRPKAVLYDLRPGQARPSLMDLPPGETLMGWSPDGSLVAVLSTNHTLRVRESLSGRQVGPALAHPGQVQRVAIGTSPLRLASVCNAGETNLEVRVWDPGSGGLIASPLAVSAGSLLLKGDRTLTQLLIVRDTDGTVARIHEGQISTWEFDLAAGVPVNPQVGSGQVWGLDFSPDGRRFAVATYGFGAQLWNTQTRKREHVLAHAGPVTCVAFSGDGSALATGSFDRTARVWDVASGTLRGSALWHFKEVTEVCWAPAGDRLLTGTFDGVLSGWNLLAGRLDFRQQAHEGLVAQMKVSAAAGVVLSLGRAGDLKCWDLASGVPVAEPVRDVPVQRGFALAGGGTVVVVPSVAGGLRRYPLPPIPAPAPPWLAEIGYGLAMSQPNEELPALLELREDARGSAGKGFFEDWRRWFFADRDTRPPSPW
ncbi:MAG: protein kinase [Verrucomicrobiales bacterium]|nr:protein kinase [Verrucomicrobiales bacterium]